MLQYMGTGLATLCTAREGAACGLAAHAPQVGFERQDGCRLLSTVTNLRIQGKGPRRLHLSICILRNSNRKCTNLASA